MKNVLTSFFLILLFTVYISAQGGTRPPGGQQGPPPGGTQGPGTGTQQGPSFDMVDMNHDGKVSWDEAKAAFGKDPNWEVEFKMRDKNSDGVVDKYEFGSGQPPAGGQYQPPTGGYKPPTGTPPGGYQPPAGGPPPGQPSFTFEQLSGGDGVISNDELLSIISKYPTLGADLKQRDKNRDGSIDKNEFYGISQPPAGGPPPTGTNPPSGYQPPTGGYKPPTGTPPPGGYNPPTGTNPPGGYQPPAGGPPPTGTNPPSGYKPPTGTPPPGGYNPPTGTNPPGGYQPPTGGQGPSFDDVDSNHDGRISKDEAKAKFGHEPDWESKFDQKDKNNDGYVDKEEFRN